MNSLFKILLLLIVVSITSFCTRSWQSKTDPTTEALVLTALEKAGENAEELEKALALAPDSQGAAMAFLIAYMPERDLNSLSSDFLLENVRLAFQVREEFSWCRDLPEEIFLNEVLPYASLDEARDNWRPDFYQRFKKYVLGCDDIYAAIDSINRNIQKETLVDYNTARSIVNISPFQSLKEKMATCTGLSFLLVDALRAVGIPARLAGTALWTNMRGNHNWVEVWIDGEWYFTEYYPDALNKSWFLADAGKADPEKPLHWIYAVSYKPSDTYFPMIWARNDSSVHAENVTQRYIDLYQEQIRNNELSEDEILVNFVLYKSEDETEGIDRIHARISIREAGKEIDFGFTPAKTDDLNRFLIFKLKKNTSYEVVFKDKKGNDKLMEITTDSISDQVISLFQN